MDDITSNRHAGVVVISFAILILGLMSTLFGLGQPPQPITPPSVPEGVETPP
jgi:hypothetical protein